MSKYVRGVTKDYHKPGYTQDRIKRWKDAAHAALGGVCFRCGFSDVRALQIDHVAGGGTRELKAGSRGAYYKRVTEQAHTGKYQLLCANCNWIKRVENAE